MIYLFSTSRVRISCVTSDECRQPTTTFFFRQDKRKTTPPRPPNSQPWFSATTDDEAAEMAIPRSQWSQLPIRIGESVSSKAGALAFAIPSATLQKYTSRAASLLHPAPPWVLMAKPSNMPWNAHYEHANQFAHANLKCQHRWFSIDALSNIYLFLFKMQVKNVPKQPKKLTGTLKKTDSASYDMVWICQGWGGMGNVAWQYNNQPIGDVEQQKNEEKVQMRNLLGESQPINTTIIMAAWRWTKTNWDGVAGVFLIRNTKN